MCGQYQMPRGYRSNEEDLSHMTRQDIVEARVIYFLMGCLIPCVPSTKRLALLGMFDCGRCIVPSQYLPPHSFFCSIMALRRHLCLCS